MRLGPDGPIEEGKIVPRRSPGLVLMRGESCSRGPGFKSHAWRNFKSEKNCQYNENLLKLVESLNSKIVKQSLFKRFLLPCH